MVARTGKWQTDLIFRPQRGSFAPLARISWTRSLPAPTITPFLLLKDRPPVTDSVQQHIASGVRNLLINCAGMTPGQSLLIVYEDPKESYYDPGLLEAFASTARQLGMVPELYEVPFERDVKDPDPRLAARIAATDRTLFLARLGDQIRFRPNGAPDTLIVSYALDREMLGSDFGNAHYEAFRSLNALVKHTLSQAREIHVTCPAGTDFTGGPVTYPEEGGDVTIKRFPVSVFTPAAMTGFSGRVAQVGFLVGTGSHFYQPYACALSETLYVNFTENRITGFDGNPADVAAAKAHYERVGDMLGIDSYFMHSWHAGIHPGCDYPMPAADNFERWSNGAFGNPRLLHFHTCGNYPPGEISLNVADPTIVVDGVAIWEHGILHPERLSGGTEMLARFPCAAHAFRMPAHNIGTGRDGQLSFH